MSLKSSSRGGSEGSYQGVRELCVALQVDLDDKAKVLAVLEQKAQAERAQLGRIEADFADEYQNALDKEVREHQAEMERLRGLSARLMSDKKELMEACKAHMEAIKADEARVAAEGQRLSREADEVLEMERKTYRACHEERLQRYLAAKAGEQRELTGRALQPELARLQLLHERELSDVETNAKTEERRMREASQARLETLIREEQEALAEDTRGTARSRGDAVLAELDASEREQRLRFNAYRADLERDLDKYTAALAAKTDKERKAGQAELRRAQEACHSRLQEMRARHLGELSAVLKDQDEQMRELRRDAEQARAALERRIRGETNDADTTSSSCPPSSSAADSPVRREAELQRDRRIQSEIRSLQAESVRLERGWKAKAEEERAEVVDARNREEKESTKRQRRLTEQVAELVVTREALSQDVRILSDKVQTLTTELLEGRREVETYERGIAAHRLRLRDLESMHAARGRDDEVAAGRQREAALAKLEQRQRQHDGREKTLLEELAALEARHVAEMESLDRQVGFSSSRFFCVGLTHVSRQNLSPPHPSALYASPSLPSFTTSLLLVLFSLFPSSVQVKDSLAQKDEDLELLRDAVHTEKVRVARLEKLLKAGEAKRPAAGGVPAAPVRKRDAFT